MARSGAVIAEGGAGVAAEGSADFLMEMVRKEYPRVNGAHSVYAWRGLASSYMLDMRGTRNRGTAGCYPAPEDVAKQGAVFDAFRCGVEVRA